MQTVDTNALIERIAADLGATDVTIRKWRSRGKVPHHMRAPLIDAAAARGYILRAAHFDNFGNAQAAA